MCGLPPSKMGPLADILTWIFDWLVVIPPFFPAADAGRRDNDAMARRCFNSLSLRCITSVNCLFFASKFRFLIDNSSMRRCCSAIRSAASRSLRVMGAPRAAPPFFCLSACSICWSLVLSLFTLRKAKRSVWVIKIQFGVVGAHHTHVGPACEAGPVENSLLDGCLRVVVVPLERIMCISKAEVLLLEVVRHFCFAWLGSDRTVGGCAYLCPNSIC